MCILIHRPKGVGKIPLGWQADFWSRNSDGFGAWWIEGDRIVIKKTLKQAEVAPIIAEIEEKDLEAGLHWRMATHGDETLKNCHPYTVFTEDGGKRVLTCIAHNGVLYRWADEKMYDTKTAERIGDSDTRQFIHKCFEPLVHAFGLKPMFIPTTYARDILEQCISGSNKLLITNFKFGFTRTPATGWTLWRGLYMSNTYAWSYNQKDKEDGPSVSVPFDIIRYPRYPGVTSGTANSQSGNGACSTSTGTCGLNASKTTSGSPTTNGSGVVKAGMTPIRCSTSMVSITGEQFALYPPDPDAGIEEWHWGPPPQTELGQAQLDASIAAYRAKIEGTDNNPFKPNVAAVTAAVKSDAEVNAIAKAVVAKISEGTGAAAAHKPVVNTERTEPTVPQVPLPSPSPTTPSKLKERLLSINEVVREALRVGRDSIWREPDAQEMIDMAYREVDAKGLPTGDEVTMATLINMPFDQVVEWCRQEPEEAGYLLQKILAEKGNVL